MLMPANRVPQFGRLGLNFPLLLQVGGWIISGIGLGFTVYESIWGAAEKADLKSGDLSSDDISSLASMIAAKDPGRSAAEWERNLTAMLGAGAPTIPPATQTCPAGFYRDPATGACLPLQKAGFFADLSTGGWIALGVGGLLLARVLKLV
jgi:hypothetical protein